MGGSAQQLLQRVPVLRGLSGAGADALAATAREVAVPAGAPLFAAGDAADGMYLVVSGRLRVVGPDGLVLRTLGHGDVVGELALLTDRVRSASVVATRDARALLVGREAFRALLASEPALLAALAERLADQLHTGSAPDGLPRGLGVVAVLDLGRRRTGAGLAAHLPGVTVLDGSAGTARWAADLEAAERRGGVLLVASPEEPSWQAFCRRSADRVLVVADAGSGQATGPCDTLAVRLRPGQPWPRWADAVQPVRRHRLETDGALPVLAHRLAGTSPGVVLSGGGARGAGHLGVLACLEESGLWPERWGGCSIGAFVAALAASGCTTAEVTAVFRAELVRRHPFRDVAVPRHALSRARRLREMLARVFGDVRVEDLPHDYFCVTADLISGQQVVHRDGLVREVVAASMAIPGLAPPVLRDGAVLVDGGVLDNLPVGVMARTGEGPVVAVDVMRRSPAVSADRPPSLFDTIAQALTIGGRERLAAGLAAADVVVTPELDDTGLLDFDRLDRCAQAGREAATTAIRRLSPLWPAGPHAAPHRQAGAVGPGGGQGPA